MGKLNRVTIFTIGVLVVLLASINFLTETAIYQESEQLSKNLDSVQMDILENMMRDYMSGISLIDDIIIDSSSHSIEASLKILDHMVNQVEPDKKTAILEIFADDRQMPLSIYDLETKTVQVVQKNNPIFVPISKINTALAFLKDSDFYYTEDIHVKMDKSIGKQRTFFYKSKFEKKLYISVVNFENTTASIKKQSTDKMNLSFGKLAKITGKPLFAVDLSGKVILSSDEKKLPLGSRLKSIEGETNIIKGFNDNLNKDIRLQLFDFQKYPDGILVKWFKMENLFILVGEESEAFKVSKGRQFLIQRILLVISVTCIVLVIALMRRNFLYYLEKNNQEGNS